MVNLTISERYGDDTVILDLKGNLIFGEEVGQLRRKIRDLLHEGKTRITLNLEELEYLDSSGIGELISTLTAIRREKDGKLKLLNIKQKARTLLKISKLLEIFDIETAEKFHA